MSCDQSVGRIREGQGRTDRLCSDQDEELQTDLGVELGPAAQLEERTGAGDVRAPRGG